jgi:hypothetical protein
MTVEGSRILTVTYDGAQGEFDGLWRLTAGPGIIGPATHHPRTLATIFLYLVVRKTVSAPERGQGRLSWPPYATLGRRKA